MRTEKQPLDLATWLTVLLARAVSGLWWGLVERDQSRGDFWKEFCCKGEWDYEYKRM